MKSGSLNIVVITGVSGAGKSTAINALEDLGFFCIDNLPPPVVLPTLEACAQAGMRHVALGMDVRVRSFLTEAAQIIGSVTETEQRTLSVIFLDASDEALLRRFSSTRRPHPLSTESNPPTLQANAVLDGIRMERELLTGLRGQATLIIDTTSLSVHDLRKRILEGFGPGTAQMARMRTRAVSFGFKFGPPVDADVVFDVRFLSNPYFVEGLRELPGTDARVRDYVLSSDEARTFLTHAEQFLGFCLPRFEREGKAYLTLAIGCTGGRHRSVVIAERLAQMLCSRLNLTIDVVHRDIDRVYALGAPGDPDTMLQRVEDKA